MKILKNCEIIEKKSRFLGFLLECEKEEEVKTFIEELKKEHKKEIRNIKKGFQKEKQVLNDEISSLKAIIVEKDKKIEKLTPKQKNWTKHEKVQTIQKWANLEWRTVPKTHPNASKNKKI